MASPERQHQLEETRELVILAYQQRLPLEQIDILQYLPKDIKDSYLRGQRAEIRAKVLISTIDIVKKVSWGTKKEDHVNKIDLWVQFIEDSNHKKIPVQVKNRQSHVNEFIKGLGVENRRIIGINAGPDSRNAKLIRDFLQQLIFLDGFL